MYSVLSELFRSFYAADSSVPIISASLYKDTTLGTFMYVLCLTLLPLKLVCFGVYFAYISGCKYPWKMPVTEHCWRSCLHRVQWKLVVCFVLPFGNHELFVLWNKLYLVKSSKISDIFFSCCAKITKWKPCLNTSEEFDFSCSFS